MALISRAACRECNQTWMRGFEDTVAPLLLPIAEDQPAVWDSIDDKTTVARWAFKTALMSTRTNKPQYWTVPDGDFRYLYEHRKPPLSATILLGRYVYSSTEDSYAAWHGSSWTDIGGDGGDRFQGYRITFSIGHAIFQVWGGIGTNDDPKIIMPNFADGEKPITDAFRHLWPPLNDPHEWPPTGARFTTSGLEMLERAWSS